MELDIRTLSFVATLSNFLMFLALATLWWVSRGEKATFYWMIGAFLMSTGFFLIGLRHYIPVFFSIVLANLSILAGFQTQCVGVYIFGKKKIHWTFTASLFALVSIGFWYFTYVDADVASRIVIISWAISLLALLAALALIKRYVVIHSLPKLFLAGVFAAYSFFMAIRGFYAFQETAIPDFMDAGAVHAWSLMTFVALSICLSIGYSIIVVARLNQELIEENKVKDRFFAIIAHDLRGPFSIISGFTTLFEQLAYSKSREELIAYAENVNAAAKGVLKLVENLLEWSQNELDRSDRNQQTIVLREFVSEALAPLLLGADKKNLNVIIQFGDEKVLFDPNILATVLRNLLGNAIKFTDAGGLISVSARTIAGNTEIVVQDSGVGISPKIRTSLFDVGTRTSTTGTDGEPGSGLGLPLCKQLLSEGQGTIEIDYTWDQGTRVIVTLPTAE